MQVSTDEVYGDLEAGGSSKETDALNPSSPYSAAKAAASCSFRRTCARSASNASITRGSNTYGPNQYPEKFIPLFVTNALDGEPLPLYGDGRQVRDWLYVEDHCAGIELVLREGEPGEAYNVGGGDEHENIEVAQRILELTGADASLLRRVADRPGHDRRYSLDTSKLQALGWSPQTTFDDGLRATVEWYRENRAWWEPIKSGEFRAYYERQYAERLANASVSQQCLRACLIASFDFLAAPAGAPVEPRGTSAPRCSCRAASACSRGCSPCTPRRGRPGPAAAARRSCEQRQRAA